MKCSTTDQPVLRVRLAAGNGIDLSGDYDLIDREFKRRLERIAGVARVDVSGAMPNEVEIAIAPDRLTAHDIGLNELAQRLQALNFSVSAGEIEDGGRRLRVQPVGEIVDLQQLRDVVINEDGLRLGDLATVQPTSARLDMGRSPDGHPGGGLALSHARNAHPGQV